MSLIATTALWLAVVYGAWTVAMLPAGARADARLAASAARALGAAGLLAVFVLAVRLALTRLEVSEAPIAVAVPLTVRTLWTDAAMRLVAWTAAVGAAAVFLAWLIRGEPRPVRARALALAGAVTLGFALLAVLGAYALQDFDPERSARPPVAVHAAAGVIARLLYLVGCAAMLVPVVLALVRARPGTARRWTLGALALVLASLTLAAWVRHAAAAPPSALDDAGAPVGAPWSSLAGLWGVAPALIAAGAYAGGANSRRDPARRRAAQLMLVLAAVLVLGAVVPALRDWTDAVDAELGFEVTPPLLVLVALPVLAAALWIAVRSAAHRGVPPRRVLIAAAITALLLPGLALACGTRNGATLLAIGAAGALAGALVAGARGTGAFPLIAQAGAAVAIAGILAATSSRPTVLELGPGMPGTMDGAAWQGTITSQGISQDEHPLYDGAIVAVELESGSRSAIETLGERIHRDAHGHAGTRTAVPGVRHFAWGDLRLVALGIRGDVALVQVQAHPLAWLAWAGAAVTIAALFGSALTAGREPHA